MKILRSSARKTTRAPVANFTGVVFSDEVVVGQAPSRMRGSVVSFTPGARTAWHSHPVGQTLFCLSGAGRVQREGEQVQEIGLEIRWSSRRMCDIGTVRRLTSCFRTSRCRS